MSPPDHRRRARLRRFGTRGRLREPKGPGGGHGIVVGMAARVLEEKVVDPATAQAHGDHAWLEQIFRAHYPSVVRHCQALGVPPAFSEDVAQQVFLVAARRRAQIDAASNVRAWLFGITRRVCANHRRGRAREQARRQHAEPPTPLPAPEQVVERAEGAALLRRLLDRLAERHRVVFVLVEIDGLSVPEASTMLGIDPGTVHAHLRTARKHMTRMIARHRRRQERSRR